jgi:hypothetical protein
MGVFVSMKSIQPSIVIIVVLQHVLHQGVLLTAFGTKDSFVVGVFVVREAEVPYDLVQVVQTSLADVVTAIQTDVVSGAWRQVRYARTSQRIFLLAYDTLESEFDKSIRYALSRGGHRYLSFF